MDTKTACNLIRSLSAVTEKDHFGSDAFCSNGRIFATVWHDKREVNLRLSLEQQRRFLLLDGEGFVEIDNAWGRQGWTRVQLGFVDRKDFTEAIKSAWEYSETKGSKVTSTRAKKSLAKKRKKTGVK